VYVILYFIFDNLPKFRDFLGVRHLKKLGFVLRFHASLAVLGERCLCFIWL